MDTDFDIDVVVEMVGKLNLVVWGDRSVVGEVVSDSWFQNQIAEFAG